MRLALALTVSYFLEFISFMILIRVLLSWFNFNPDNRLIRIVYQLTEPVLEPFRKLTARMGLNTGMIDFSPFISMLVLYYIVKPLLLTLIATFF